MTFPGLSIELGDYRHRTSDLRRVEAEEGVPLTKRNLQKGTPDQASRDSLLHRVMRIEQTDPVWIVTTLAVSPKIFLTQCPTGRPLATACNVASGRLLYTKCNRLMAQK